jgi:EmrB/QacA subfamily drug resistance transporter
MSPTKDRIETHVWLISGVVIMGMAMSILDTTIVNVALATLGRDLHSTISQIQWVVTGYMLALAAVIPLSGWAAQRFGTRRMYITSLVLFTAGSMLCGISTTATELIIFRVVQGVGGGMLMPLGMMMMAGAAGPKRMGRVMSIVSMPMMLAPILGPTIGGLIVDNASWQWIFYVNVPIGVLGLITTIFVVPESKDTSHEQRLDLPGLITSGIGLLALVYALIEGHSYGWTSVRIVGLLVVAVVAIASFVLLELHQRLPMLDVTLFRNGTFVGANLVAILVTMAMFGIFVFFPIYMQTFRGWSPIQAGAALLPWTLMVVIFAPIAGKLSDRVGSRWLMAGGMTVVAICCLDLSMITLTSSFWQMLPGFVLGGLGMSFVMTPMSAAAMGAVSVDKAGVASGVLNTFRQVGVAPGIAIMGAIITNRAAAAARDGADPPQAFVHGLTFGMRVSAAICLSAALAAALLVRRYRHFEQSQVAEAA